MQQVNHKLVYRVTSFGIDVEWTDDERAARKAFKDTKTADLWCVNGPVVSLLDRKREYTSLDGTARYKS